MFCLEKILKLLNFNFTILTNDLNYHKIQKISQTKMINLLK